MNVYSNSYSNLISNDELGNLLPTLPSDAQISLFDFRIEKTSGYGHWRITIDLKINEEEEKYTVITTNSTAVDAYNSDEEERQSEGIKELLSEVLTSNAAEIETSAL